MRRAALSVIAVPLLLAGCSSSGEDDGQAAPSLPSTSSAAESDGPARSDRGNIIKAFGEEGGFCSPTATTCTAEDLVLTFTVDSVTVDPECTSGFANPPDNGHFIGINLRVATSAEYPPDYYATFTAADFSVIGPDGLTVDDVQGQAYLCLGPAGFTQDLIGPGQQYAGTVVIDSPATSGTLVYKAAGEATGWEWQF